MPGGFGGFIAGGLAKGFDQEQQINNQANFQQQQLKLQADQQKNQQQRVLYARADKARSDLMGNISDTIEQYRIAHPDASSADVARLVAPLKAPLLKLDQSSGRDPTASDAQITAMIATPSKAVTEAILSRAKDPYKAQLDAIKIQEAQANIAALKQGTDLERMASGAGNKASAPNAASSNAGAPGDAAAAPPTPEEAGEQFLQKLTPGVRDQVQAIAEYRENPNNLPSRIAKGASQSQRELYVGLAEQYAAAKGEQYDQSQFAGRNKAVSEFSSGKTAATVKSFNVLVDHLDVLKDASTALGNGNIQAFNTIKNAIAAQTGESAPTDFNGVKELVGDEIVKAVSGGAGALGDRDQIKATINAQGSPQQLANLITKYQKLAGSQLSGLRQQYESTTNRKDFNKFLNPRTKKLFEQPDDSSDQGGGVSGTSGPVKWKVVQ